jgi:hypothetical protein
MIIYKVTLGIPIIYFSYYGLEQLNDTELTAFLTTIVDNCLSELCASFCVCPDQVHHKPYLSNKMAIIVF